METQQVDSESYVKPPWGAFPAEQYLIVSSATKRWFSSVEMSTANDKLQRHWDASSSASRPDQTRELIRAFLQLETIPEAWDTTGRTSENTAMERVPTDEEVCVVLAPWRPLRWRQAALSIWEYRFDEAVWLRTHYGDESNDKFGQFRETHEDWDPRFDKESLPWAVLDDPDVFNFEENWERVFDILPELAGPGQGYSRVFASGANQVFLAETRQELREAVLRADDREEEAEAGVAGTQLQLMAVAMGTYLIVVDQKAFESEGLRILYLDARGNIIRHSRIAPEDIWIARGQWEGCRYNDGQWWVIGEEGYSTGDGVLGEKYRAKGEIGRVLYDVGDLL
jgi:hypothetical protein